MEIFNGKVCEFTIKYLFLQLKERTPIDMKQQKQKQQQQQQQEKTLTLKTLNKGNVWEVQESDIFRMWEMAAKEADLRENVHHYITIIKSAFEMEEVKIDKPEVIKKYEARGFKVGCFRVDEENKMKWAIKKKPILRVTDLTYENIRHISAATLLEVLDRNFGGGWDSLSQSIKDIIETGFDISTTTLPKNRLHKAGGMYEKKVADGFSVLEITKGTWVEAIFAKEKPEMEKPRMKFDSDDVKEGEEDEDEDLPEMEDAYEDEEEDDNYDEEQLTEESYRTTYETEEDLDLEASEMADDEVF